MHKSVLLAIAISLVLVPSIWAQGPPPPATTPRHLLPLETYKLEFVIYEVEGGKRVNSRSYSVIANNNNMPSTLRIGLRLPVEAEKGTEYMDVGVKITAILDQRDNGQLNLTSRFEMTSLSPEQNGARQGTPVLRSLEYVASTLPREGERIQILSGEDIDTLRTFEIEVLMTKQPEKGKKS